MNEFRICPECGYKRGFHASFKKKDDNLYKIIFICPSCGSAYDINLETSSINNLKAQKTDQFGES